MDSDRELETIRRRKMQEYLNLKSSGHNPNFDVQTYSTRPVVLTDGNFNDELSKNRLILVDFWAEWCGPCKMISPVIDELAKEYAGKFVFGRLNVDENPNIAGMFRIRSIPTLLIFKDGKVVDGILGAVAKRQIESKILPYMN